MERSLALAVGPVDESSISWGLEWAAALIVAPRRDPTNAGSTWRMIHCALLTMRRIIKRSRCRRVTYAEILISLGISEARHPTCQLTRGVVILLRPTTWSCDLDLVEPHNTRNRTDGEISGYPGRENSSPPYAKLDDGPKAYSGPDGATRSHNPEPVGWALALWMTGVFL